MFVTYISPLLLTKWKYIELFFISYQKYNIGIIQVIADFLLIALITIVSMNIFINTIWIIP